MRLVKWSPAPVPYTGMLSAGIKKVVFCTDIIDCNILCLLI